MAHESTEVRRFDWSECCEFRRIFRSFRMAIGLTKLLLAFALVLSTYLAGRLLDAISFSASQPRAVFNEKGVVLLTEADAFILHKGNVDETRRSFKDYSGPGTVRPAGAFAVLMRQVQGAVHGITTGVLTLRPALVGEAFVTVLFAKLWLVRMHPWFALFFGLLALGCWAFFGGAIARAVALHAARDEQIGTVEALTFARRKFIHFFLAPLFPLGLVVVGGLVLGLFGLIGAIPGVGELLVGPLFFVALIIGLPLAAIAILTVAGGWLMYPTIATESGEFTLATSSSFNYVVERPWNAAFYAVLSLLYGAICLFVVKLLARVALVMTHLFVGLAMNIGGAEVPGPPGQPAKAPNKLHVLWQPPTLDMDSPLYGRFDHRALAGRTERFGRFCIEGWVYCVYGAVAAFAISLFFCASGISYLLLRRQVDAVDYEEVIVEEEEVGPPPAPGGPGGGAAVSGSSLPIVGQNG